MKYLLSIVTVFMCLTAFGQERTPKDILTELDLNYKKEYGIYLNKMEEFDSIGKILSVDSLENRTEKLKVKKAEIVVSTSRLDSIREIALGSEIHFLSQKKASKEDTENWLENIKKYSPKIITQNRESIQETQIYTYFDKNRVINHELFDNKSPESQILKDVLLEKGEESYLGDISIPKNNQVFYFYDNDNKVTNVKFKFKKIDVEIKDGYFYDIRVFVEDDYKNTHVFANAIGISLLFYSQFGDQKKLLIYQYSSRKEQAVNEYTDEELKKLCIKVTDVMSYTYRTGNHYIPHDLILELPAKDTKGHPTNERNTATYQIKQETYLEKIVELRTYTDFLGLFGKSDNGLIQIEGKAKFYLFPYPFHFLWSKRIMGQIEYLPSLSPFINYSRLDDNSRYVDMTDTLNLGNFEIEKKISLIEKRYLSMGLEAEILKWQHKNAPIRISFYGVVNYNISEIRLADEIQNVKSCGYGLGFHLSTQRFNNFGFSHKTELTKYDYKNFNDYINLAIPNFIQIFKNEAEIFYHPNGNPNQSIFTRLAAYNYSGKNNNEAFYQFQFGYKFAVGARTVKERK